MTFAVVACSECSWPWIVEDVDDQDSTSCPRCGTHHSTQSRRRLFATDDPSEAAEVRGAILADQAGEHDAYQDGVDHFADLEDLAREGVIDDDVFLQELGVDPTALEDPDDNTTDTPPSGPQRSAEGPEVDVDVAESAGLRTAGADRPHLTQTIDIKPFGSTPPVDATVHRDVSPRSSEWLPEVLEEIVPTAAAVVQDLAAEHAPQALEDGRDVSLFVRNILLDDVADLDEDVDQNARAETHAYMDGIARYALLFTQSLENSDDDYLQGRGELGEQLLEEVEDVLTSTGTGRGPWNAGVDALRHAPVALHEQAASPPTLVFVLDGPEWTDASNDTVERALETLHVLAQGVDVQVFASPTTTRTLRRAAERVQDREEPVPDWAESLTEPQDTSRPSPVEDARNEASLREDAWELLADGAHKDGHRFILQNLREEATRSVQDLKHDDAIDYAASTVDRYLSELEDLGLVDVTRSSSSSNELQLTPLGTSARALVADDGSIRHPAQSRLEGERYANPPRPRKCSVTPQPAKRGPVEEWLADTGDPREEGWVQWLGDAREERRLQPPVMHDRILAGRRVEGVNLVEDRLLDWTDDDQAPNGDGRVVYASAFDEEIVLSTQWGGSAATLARLAAALLSDRMLSKVLAPSNMGVQFEQLYGADSFKKDLEDVLQRGAQVGWLSEEELAHIDEWRDRIRGVRAEVLRKLAQLDDLDKGLRSQWFRDVHGLLCSATTLYEAAGLHVNINLRFPNARELGRDDDRLEDLAMFLGKTVTKQAGFRDENGWHSIYRMLMEDRPQKLRARLPYDVQSGEESADLTTSWILQGYGVDDLQDLVEDALEAEGNRVRERVQEGVEDAAVLDVPVVQASTTAHTRRLVREHADRKGFDGADVDELTRVLEAHLATDDRGPVPMDVADVLMALESRDGAGDRLDAESLAVGLATVPVEKLLPELPPSATRMLQALLEADSSLTRQDLIELTSENSVDRHLEKLLATDLVEAAGSSEYVAFVEPWWSPGHDGTTPREDAHETRIESTQSPAGVLFDVSLEETHGVLEQRDWQLFAMPVDVEELVDALPGWEWFIRYTWRLFDGAGVDDDQTRVVLGAPTAERDAEQVALPQRPR